MGRKLNNIDLTPTQRKTVLALLKRHLPNTEVWAYGSRVKFSSKPSSDLDLVAFSNPEQDIQVGILKEAFEESGLPFRVDLFVWDEVPDSFKTNIEAERVILHGGVNNSVPEGWKEVRLSDVALINTGKANRIDACESGKFPLFDRSQTIRKSNNFIFDCEAVIVPGEGKEFIPRYYSGKFDLHQRTYRITAIDSQICQTKFLFYALTHLRKYWEAVAVGSTVKSLRMNSFLEFPLLLPSIKEQHSIVRILSSLDDKIELNRRMNKTLEDMAQAIFKSWFIDFEPVKAKMAVLEAGGTVEQAELASMSVISGMNQTAIKKLNSSHPTAYAALKKTSKIFPCSMEDSDLGEVPQGWGVKKLGDILSLKKGKCITKKLIQEGAVPVVAGGIYPAYFHKYSNVSAPAVTISASGANAGLVNLYFVEIWASDCSYISSGQTDFIFSFYLFLKSKQREIFRMQHGAAQPHIYPKDLERLIIADPPKKIWSTMEKQAKILFSLRANCLAEIETLSKQRDNLIPKLISGTIQISDTKVSNVGK